MRLQDVVLSVGVWVLIFSLLPTLFAKEKPALVTSLVTGTTLLVFAVVYLSLMLWGSAFSSAVLAILWWILAFQKYESRSRSYGGGEIPY